MLSLIQTHHSDASAAENFFKYCDERRNCSKLKFSASSATMFLTRLFGIFRKSSAADNNCIPGRKDFNLNYVCSWYAKVQQTTFENIMAKEEISQNEQFLLLPQCFQCEIFFTFLYLGFQFLYLGFQSRLLQICCMWERI